MQTLFCITLILSLACTGIASAIDAAQLLAEAEGDRDWIIGCRRELHAIPELAYEEVKTSSAIRKHLDELGIPYDYPLAVTGLSARIGSGKPVVALRTDIDALPILEGFDEAQVPFKSTHPGLMHACGHDTHAAMLLGAARILKRREASLQGTVLLLFQPAEEGRGGAARVISEGWLEGVQAISGIHVWPSLPSGVVATRPGTIMAAADMFAVRIVGRGGHGAIPHLTNDPVVAAAAVVTALQSVVSRETSPTDSAVITVARFNTGPGAPNVIPDSVYLEGTMRALTLEGSARLRRRFAEVVTAVANAHGCNATDFFWEPEACPPTVNDPSMAALVGEVAGQLAAAAAQRSGEEGKVQFTTLPEPSMAAEDFSHYGHQVPAVFTFLGIGNASLGTTMGLHTSTFQMDESQLALGSALHAGMALELLDRLEAPAAAHHEEL